ncbi:hypothetical protein H4Q26_017111 [Puccinia striiformis f. sp. tritici PST-130]|nr:hypothetical protein H4Q26_017111 [Puccinia striiformis f. sp. tritici PST-130]
MSDFFAMFASSSMIAWWQGNGQINNLQAGYVCRLTTWAMRAESSRPFSPLSASLISSSSRVAREPGSHRFSTLCAPSTILIRTTKTDTAQAAYDLSKLHLQGVDGLYDYSRSGNPVAHSFVTGNDLYGGSNRLLTYIKEHNGITTHTLIPQSREFQPFLVNDSRVRMVLLESPTNHFCNQDSSPTSFCHQQYWNGLAPFECFLLTRGIKTLSLRLDRQQASAIRIAKYLDHLGFSFEPVTEIERKIVSSARLWGISVSFGCVNSLISMPCLMSPTRLFGNPTTLLSARERSSIRRHAVVYGKRAIAAAVNNAATAWSNQQPIKYRDCNRQTLKRRRTTRGLSTITRSARQISDQLEKSSLIQAAHAFLYLFMNLATKKTGVLKSSRFDRLYRSEQAGIVGIILSLLGSAYCILDEIEELTTPLETHQELAITKEYDPTRPCQILAANCGLETKLTGAGGGCAITLIPDAYETEIGVSGIGILNNLNHHHQLEESIKKIYLASDLSDLSRSLSYPTKLLDRQPLINGAYPDPPRQEPFWSFA